MAAGPQRLCLKIKGGFGVQFWHADVTMPELGSRAYESTLSSILLLTQRYLFLASSLG